jgi:hypothetical protein
MIESAASCREEARRVRAEAAETSSPVVKEHLEGIAGSYEVLARFLDVLDAAAVSAATSSAAAKSKPDMPG